MAERKERKVAKKKKNRKGPAKKKKKKFPNFGLCACTKLKKCTFLHLISGKSTFKVGNDLFVKINTNLESLQPKK